MIFLLINHTKLKAMRQSVLIIGILLLISATGVAQQRTQPVKTLKEKSSKWKKVNNDALVNHLQYQPFLKSPSLGFTEDLLGSTIYDLQSNSSSPYGRLVRFDDGTFSAVWTRGMNPTAYSDRGTGYNYFDGTSWLSEPTMRLETVRTGWPSVAANGLTGEAVVSHRNATSPLKLLKRTFKGTGNWTESEIIPPAGASGIEWPRMVSSGENNENLHIICLTGPTSLGGTVYNGQDGAIVYTRSTNLGLSWSTPVVLPGLGAEYYRSFSSDVYEFAKPFGDQLAFAVVDNSCDMILMRSYDNGETWEKTVIWEHPYPMLNPSTTPTDTLYAPDGGVSLAFDKFGKLHVVFGVYRMLFIGDGTYTYWPGLSGIAYWNEDMPTFTGGDQMNILNPDDLDADGKLIGYYNIDWNGDGELNYLEGDDFYGNYGCGWASMPQLAFDDNGNAILLYSSLIENFDNGIQNYRHIWCRASSDNAQTWGPVIDLSDEPVHLFDECVFPSIATSSDENNWYFTYHIDNEPGLAIQGDEDPPSDNYCNFYHLSKIVNSGKEQLPVTETLVSNNYPEPFKGITNIDLVLKKPSSVGIRIFDFSGKLVLEQFNNLLTEGSHKLSVDLTNLPPAVYSYTIQAGTDQYRGKMIKR